MQLGFGPGGASALVAPVGVPALFGTTPISHGYFEGGAEDSLPLEPLPNLVSKALIPFVNKMQLLYWLRIYRSQSAWKHIDAMAAELLQTPEEQADAKISDAPPAVLRRETLRRACRAWRAPSVFSATKPTLLANTVVNPVPLGAPLPPNCLS